MKSTKEKENQLSCLDSVINSYSITKLDRPLELLTYDQVRLVGVTEIGINKHFGIVYFTGKRKHYEKETEYTIIN